MSRLRKIILALGDAALFFGALALTLLIRYPLSDLEGRWQDHIGPFAALLPAWLLVFSIFDLYRQRAFVNYNAMANRILGTAGTAILVSIVLFYLFPGFFVLTPKTNLFIFAAVLAFLTYLWHASFIAFARFRPLPAIILGGSDRVRELTEHLSSHPHVGLTAVATLESLDPGASERLEEMVKRTGARVLIVQPKITKDPRLVRELYELLGFGITILNFANLYEEVFERVPLEELEEGWFIEHVTTRRPAYDRAKRLVDFTLATTLFIILIPISVLIAFFIKISSKGPAVFSQERVGRNDKPFKLYKFRTMNTWKGGEDGTPAWTEENDPRVTKLGKVLRFTHLDEIPQLWNIIRGDISFTGPRAERVELVRQFKQFPYYDIRHVVQPGLTGWAQINYRPSASLDEAKMKLAYDIYYIKNRSFLLDLAIILKTAKYLVIKPEEG